MPLFGYVVFTPRQERRVDALLWGGLERGAFGCAGCAWEEAEARATERTGTAALLVAWLDGETEGPLQLAVHDSLAAFLDSLRLDAWDAPEPAHLCGAHAAAWTATLAHAEDCALDCPIEADGGRCHHLHACRRCAAEAGGSTAAW